SAQHTSLLYFATCLGLLVQPSILTGVILVVDRQPVEAGLQSSCRHDACLKLYSGREKEVDAGRDDKEGWSDEVAMAHNCSVRKRRSSRIGRVESDRIIYLVPGLPVA